MKNMDYLVEKFIRAIKEKGIVVAFSKCINYPITRIKWFSQDLWLKNAWKKNLPAEVIFQEIYKRNFWKDGESVSGVGSTLKYTAPLRNSLPNLFSKFNIEVVLDAPCGDFNWMQQVVENNRISYIGADIVPALITANAQKFPHSNLEFCVIDITKDKFPNAQLWICRDCLFHLSYEDIYLALKNFTESNVDFILTTTYLVDPGFMNSNIKTGGFRLIDLFGDPFSFPQEVLFRIVDYVEPSPPREMCLWSKAQILTLLPSLKIKLDLLNRANSLK